MKRNFGFYCAQALLGSVVAAVGALELAGQGAMARWGELIGLGPTQTLFAGYAQLVAGLCLLVPGGAIPATVLLAALTVCGLGVSVGQSNLLNRAPSQVPIFGCVERDASERGANVLPLLRSVSPTREQSI